MVDAEALALAFETFDLPPMAARILVHLAATDDPYLSLDGLATALGASKASMSTMARVLAQRGLIELAPVRASRRAHYRLAAGAWARLHRERSAAFETVARLAAGGDSAALRHLDDFFTQAAADLADLADHYEESDPDR